MNSDIHASVELYGSVLRYAEVEGYGERLRLLRLGSCTFDFDVHKLLRNGRSDQLTLLRDAVLDVFSGSEAGSLRVAVHPPGPLAFFAPVAAEATPEDQQQELRRQATYMLDVSENTDLHLETDRLYADTSDADNPSEWIHALALPAEEYAAFSTMLQELPFETSRLQMCTHAAANVLHRQIERASDDESPAPDAYSIALGVYPAHLEFTFSKNRRWRFSTHTPSGPAVDGCYFFAALLNRLSLTLADVDAVYLYGEDADFRYFDRLRELLSGEPKWLDAFHALDYDREGLSEDFRGAAYLPVIGALL